MLINIPLTESCFKKRIKENKYISYTLQDEDSYDSIELYCCDENVIKQLDFEVSCGILRSVVEISKRYSELKETIS